MGDVIKKSRFPQKRIGVFVNLFIPLTVTDTDTVTLSLSLSLSIYINKYLFI